MNKKGFTMIELLMVIVIIGILSMILIPNVMKIVKKNNDNNIKSIESNVVSAAKEYVSDNKYNLNFDCDANKTKEITLSTLVTNGYLTNNIVNPETKQKYNLDTNKVIVTYNCTTKKFTYNFSLE